MIYINSICLYGDCDHAPDPGCICGCHTEEGCDHDHTGATE